MPNFTEYFRLFSSRTRQFRYLMLVFFVSFLGCWEEVHYMPESGEADTQDVLAPPATPPEQADNSGDGNAKVEPEDIPQEPVPKEIKPEVQATPEEVPVTPPHEVAAPVETESEATVAAEDSTKVDEVAAVEAEVDDPFDDLFDDDSVGESDAVAEENDAKSTTPNENTEPEAELEMPKPTAPARTELATWQMCSKWSMAVALQAKGRDADSFGERLEQAKYGAELLEVSLPALLTFEEGADRLSANLVYLLEDAGPRLAEELKEHYGAEHAGLAELATKTHVLLLSYTPDSTRLGPVIVAIRQAAESSGLPERVWRELLELLESRAEFVKVKAAIFKLHKQAATFLSDPTSL